MANDLDTWTQHGYSEATALLIIQYLRAEKRRLLDRANPTTGTSAERLNLRRHVRTVIQRKAAKFRSHRRYNIPRHMLTAVLRTVPLLDDLYPDRRSNWKDVTRRPGPFHVPTISLKGFSFIHDPIGTMEKLAKIIEIEGRYVRAAMDFDDKECPDIGPYLLLQAIRENLAPVFIGGNIELDIQRVIEAVGLRGPLHMAPFNNAVDSEDIWPFHLKQRRPGRSPRSASRLLAPQKKEVVADQFVGELNRWLQQVATAELSALGRRLVLKMLGEALDNAERHSRIGSNDGDWSMTGYLVRRKRPTGDEYRIHLAMLSIGASISESISSGPPEMVERMQRYCRRHRSAALTDELLSTIFALQDGVTKDHAAAAGHRGGTGFQEIFAFFGDLGATPTAGSQAELVIVSGKACIRVADPYIPRIAIDPALNVERQMWFNAANSPANPPDLACVIALPRRLHGTLITMSIPLDQGYLESLTNVAN